MYFEATCNISHYCKTNVRSNLTRQNERRAAEHANNLATIMNANEIDIHDIYCSLKQNTRCCCSSAARCIN